MLLTPHLKPSELLPCDIRRWWLLTFLHNSTCSSEKIISLHSLTVHSLPQLPLQPWPSRVYPASRPGSCLNSPLLRTLKPPPWSRPQHRFLEQRGSCFLLSAPSLSLFSPLPTLPREAASENANLMISWQLKIFCHFPSRIKFQVLRRNDNLLRLPFATSPFFLHPAVLLAFLQFWASLHAVAFI